MIKTVEEILKVADDSVSLIIDINTYGALSKFLPFKASQSEVIETLQRNVVHLETILAYDGNGNNVPDVAGSTADKSSYTAAITTGKDYIAANSGE
tara:strand:+ start:869 stop:1156 length:288 start_codon:yes stop_codon:yes gene_type:complete